MQIKCTEWPQLYVVTVTSKDDTELSEILMNTNKCT